MIYVCLLGGAHIFVGFSLFPVGEASGEITFIATGTNLYLWAQSLNNTYQQGYTPNGTFLNVTRGKNSINAVYLEQTIYVDCTLGEWATDYAFPCVPCPQNTYGVNSSTVLSLSHTHSLSPSLSLYLSLFSLLLFEIAVIIRSNTSSSFCLLVKL